MLGPVEDAAGRRRACSAAHRDALTLAHRNALRLLKLVNTLLDFSRIEAGRIEAVYEPIDLAAFTAELASAFRAAIEKAGRQLRRRLPARSPSRSIVDREMWEKIVLNLISNAFKFTFEGEIRVACGRAGTDASSKCAIRGAASPPMSWPTSSSDSIESRAPKAGRTKAPASAWRWCTNW